MTLARKTIQHISGGARGLVLASLLGVLSLLPTGGCGDFSCDRAGENMAGLDKNRAPEWTFDGRGIVDRAGAPIVSPVADVRWAAVVDADSRRTAWLVIPQTEEARLREVEPGRKWAGAGYVCGPGPDVSEVLRDNRLLEYKWEVERADDNSLAVRYTAKVLQHVVLASFSKFTLRFPLRLFHGSRAILNDTFGGVIPEGGAVGPVHPSYWEGPASTLDIVGNRLSLDLEMDEDSFNWVSFLDGRALPGPDSLLVIELYPSIAGPHERLGKLAVKGTSYTASFRLKLSPPRTPPPGAEPQGEAMAQSPPVALTPRLAEEIGDAGWEIEPFVPGGAGAETQGPSFDEKAFSCEIPISDRSRRWRLSVGGAGRPLPAFIAVRGPVDDVRVKINDRGDCLDGRELVEELGVLTMDPARRAEAVWRYAAETTYSMPLHPTPDLGEFLGSYGYGFSSTLSAMALVKLWGHASLPARRVYLSGRKGYAIAEAYYGGRWHAFDLAERTFYVTPAGEVASAEDLVSAPWLVEANSDASGMGPGGAPADETARLKYEGAGLSYNPGGLSFERLMRIRLARGETLLRMYRPLGKWAPSPRRPHAYANALLAFTPDFEDRGALEGFSSSTNFKVEDGALIPEDRSATASLEYRARSPYVITGARLSIDAGPGTLERASVMLSKDGGGSWTPLELEPASGTADFTGFLVPGPQEPGTAYEKLERNFGFDLHLELSPAPGEESAAIKDLSVVTWCQVNPALLPRLSAGDNEIVTRCAEWKPGAAVTLGWTEGSMKTDPEYGFPGESFHVMGDIISRGPPPAGGVRVTAYVPGAAGKVPLGSWRGAAAPGQEKTPFDLACGPVDPRSHHPETAVSEYDLMLEIGEGEPRGAPPPWSARFHLKLPLSTRPDLVARPSLVKVTPPRPRPGDEVRITAVVRNFCPSRDLLYMQGTRSQPTEAALYDAGSDPPLLIQRVPVPELAPGSAALVTFNWSTPESPGRKTLLVVLDPDDTVRERDENDSTAIEVNVAR